MSKELTVAKLNNALNWSTRFKNFLGTLDYATGAVAITSLMASMVFIFLKGRESIDGHHYDQSGEIKHTGHHYGEIAGDLFAVAFLQRLVAGFVDGLIYGNGYSLRFGDLSASLQAEVRALLQKDTEAQITINDDDSVTSIIERLSEQRFDMEQEMDAHEQQKLEESQLLLYVIPAVAGGIVGLGAACRDIYSGDTSDGSIKVMLGSALVMVHQVSFWTLNRIRDVAFNVGANTSTYLGNQWRSAGGISNNTGENTVASTPGSTDNQIPLAVLQ